MVSHRAKGVVEIVEVHDRLHAGNGGFNTAAQRVKRELFDRADR